MGFDPRQWSTSRSRVQDPGADPRVTVNLTALLAENEALRREVRRLQRELERQRRQQWVQSPRWQEPSASPPPRVSADQVRRWGEAMAQQAGWTDLRQSGLEALVDRLNRSSFHPQLSLQQRLDRLVSGLGTDLLSAVGRRATKKGMAVLAAFALYGVRASEWLDEDPARVVAELRQRLRPNSSRRTRTDQRSTDQRSTDQRSSDRRQSNAQAWTSGSDPLAVLGLQAGASQEAIKQAFRRLVKQHHPDMGGSAEAFRRISEAYQSLMA
ncbi:J domain-containing protein [Synechococcus sp. BS55D]|uniref:J domain-containing protein n=1 Tax=Synechococcus sp. BS55D TaxID=2055943 RepID=UPI00103E00C7|nr:J domain-containing protein [Synechococcus sp. BS55D]TCD56348.1 molecular chaperone DnaJ [Synechococcus sp. BS55D]